MTKKRQSFEKEILKEIGTLKTIVLDDRLSRIINFREEILFLKKTEISQTIFNIFLLVIGVFLGFFMFTRKWIWIWLILDLILFIQILKILKYRSLEKKELNKLKGGRDLRRISQKIIKEGA